MNTTKEHILEAIRKNQPSDRDYAHPGLPTFSISEKAILDEFKENLVAGGGQWREIKDMQEAQVLIQTLHPDAKVICSAAPEIAGNKDLSKIENPHDLNDVDVGVVRADFGVSDNGMVWLTEKDMGMPALGFLSQHLIVLLKPTQLVRNMREAYERVNLPGNHYGCFMLGPSATADIGAVMQHGAQGVRSLTVFFM